MVYYWSTINLYFNKLQDILIVLCDVLPIWLDYKIYKLQYGKGIQRNNLYNDMYLLINRLHKITFLKLIQLGEEIYITNIRIICIDYSLFVSYFREKRMVILDDDRYISIRQASYV